MLEILFFLLDTVVGFFGLCLIMRAAMRAARISFVGQMGQFVLATTDWAVRPLARLFPTGRVDYPALLAAWGLHVLLVLLKVFLLSKGLTNPLSLLAQAVLMGGRELLYQVIYLLIGVLILSAVLSWVNPHAPIAPMLNAVTRPLLDPIRKRIPPIGNVDLSPLVLLVVLQVLLRVLSLG